MSLGPIACPSVSLCVAADSSGAVLTSIDPAGGSAAWQRGPVDDGENYECSHYGETGPGCAVKITGIACPSVSLCALVDGGQGAYRTTDPAAGASFWQGVGGDSDEGYYGLACPSTKLCLTATGYDVQAATFDPSTTPEPGLPAVTVRYSISSFALSTPACASPSACFLASARPGILSASDPTGPASTWAFQPTAAVGESISCPTQSLCMAADANGTLLIGSPPTFSAREIKADLRRTVSALRTRPERALRSANRIRLAFRANVAGHVEIDLSHARAGSRSPTRLDQRSLDYSKPGKSGQLTIKLTTASARLLVKRHNPVLIVLARFRAASKAPVMLQQRIRL